MGRLKRCWDGITVLANRIRPEVPFRNPYRENRMEKSTSTLPFNRNAWNEIMNALR